MMRVLLNSTIDEGLLNYLRLKALELRVDTYDFSEVLIVRILCSEVHSDDWRRSND